MGNKEGDIRRLRPISQACGPKEFPDDRDTSFALPAVDAGHSWHLSSAQRASFAVALPLCLNPPQGAGWAQPTLGVLRARGRFASRRSTRCPRTRPAPCRAGSC